MRAAFSGLPRPHNASRLGAVLSRPGVAQLRATHLAFQFSLGGNSLSVTATRLHQQLAASAAVPPDVPSAAAAAACRLQAEQHVSSVSGQRSNSLSSSALAICTSVATPQPPQPTSAAAAAATKEEQELVAHTAGAPPAVKRRRLHQPQQRLSLDQSELQPWPLQQQPAAAGGGASNHSDDAGLISTRTQLSTAQQDTAGAASRSSKLRLLEAFLGYKFRDLSLLNQACTHDSSGSQQPSYRQLAFVGDAALWLLFVEHAFKTHAHLEDPISGAWPTHLSRLLSRANCAATARQWGLDAYLQHSTPPPAQQQQRHQQPWLPQQYAEAASSLSRCSSADSLASVNSSSTTDSSHRSSSSSSSIRNSGMNAGVWTSDTLAEMFEGLVGALLLDSGSDYQTVKQLLLPWVADSFHASKHATTAAAAAAAGGGGGGSPTLDSVTSAHAAAVASVAGLASLQHQAAASVQAHQQQVLLLQEALSQQLLQHCGYQFATQESLSRVCSLVMQLMCDGVCSADAESLRFLGFGIVQYTAAMQAYCCQHQQWLVAGQEVAASAEAGWDLSGVNDSSSSSESSVGQAVPVASPVSSSSSRVNVVHLMSKQAAGLTTLRHRAKMWLLLLEGSPWCPPHSHLTTSSWKKQKQTLSRCVDLLVACVYLDSGLEAALGVAGFLVRNTPPTTHDKSWMPEWARKK